MASEVEVKVLIPEAEWPLLRDAAGLGEPAVRRIWFFETPERSLGAAGVILRVRAERSAGDATAKLRGRALAADLVELLEEGKGFKVERDFSEGSSVLAFSITDGDKSLALDRVSDRALSSPRGLFSRRQRALAALGAGEIDWGRVRPFGPIEARGWEAERKGLELSLERWTVGGASVIEVSARGESPDALLRKIQRTLSKWGVSSDGLEGGKTRWALDRLAR